MADCDASQIHQVIRNLLINAGEAMPDGGRISVGCGRVSVDRESALSLLPGDYAIISVQDTGTGIPEESMGKIFDPYFTTKDKYSRKGSGLGLTICHAIIKKHDGLMTVESALGIEPRFMCTCRQPEKRPEDRAFGSRQTRFIIRNSDPCSVHIQSRYPQKGTILLFS